MYKKIYQYKGLEELYNNYDSDNTANWITLHTDGKHALLTFNTEFANVGNSPILYPLSSAGELLRLLQSGVSYNDIVNSRDYEYLGMILISRRFVGVD